DGELRVQLGRGGAELLEVAPGALAQVGDGARRDLGAPALRGGDIEARGEGAEDARVLALLGELVDALEAAPRAVLELGGGDQVDERGARGLGARLVKLDEEV